MLVLLRTPTCRSARVVRLVHDADATVHDLLVAIVAIDATDLSGVDPAPLASGLHVDGSWREGRLLLAETSLRHGATVSVGRRSEPQDGPLPAVSLDVIGGLLAGQLHPLATGQHVLGRSGTVRLEHLTVSKRHALLTVGPDGSATVTDLGSRNGTTVAGRWVRQPHEISPSTLVTVGALQLELRPPATTPPAPGEVDRDGRAPFHRPPRTVVPEVSEAIPVPPAPSPPPVRSPFAWSAAAVPLVVGLAMAAALGPVFALFALLSPAAVVGGWFEHRLRARRHERRTGRQLQADAASLAVALRHRTEDEVRRRADRAPDVAQLVRRAHSLSPSLWERRGDHADAFVLRLGTGDVPWEPTLDTTPDPEWATRPALATAVDANRTLVGGAVSVDLGAGDVGIAGDRRVGAAVARSLVLQAALLHGPADLVLRADGDDWAWARWLPHHGLEPGEARRVLEAHDVPPRRAPDDDRVRRIVVADDPTRLPASCATVVQLEGTDGTASVLDVRTGLRHEAVLMSGAPAAVAADAARAVAHLGDPERGHGGALRSQVALHDLVELDARAVRTRWERPSGALPVVLGQTVDGPLVLDLVTDGPHALVAGTTGSGKSELLRTLVASLALASSPEQLAFVLLDFKGGSAFDRCVELPHVTGVVTDLDGSLVQRVLQGLEAELRHREARLRAAGVDDLDALQRNDTGGEPLPRLVLVVDEFAVLATEAPDVLGGLVDVAQRGRSLGIHLVLATQRPSGIVTDRIRANTNLRLVLRTVDPTDSFDLLGSAAASSLDRRAPGRVLVRVGADEPAAAQTALVTGPHPTTSGPPVRLSLSSATLPDPVDALETDLDAVVRITRDAAGSAGCERPRRPWTDPLPTQLPISQLDAGSGPLSGIAVGRLDDLDQRTQPTCCWQPLRGHLVVHGASGSGVTGTLAVAASQAAAAGMEVHVLDPAGDLGAHDGGRLWSSCTDPADRRQLEVLVEALRAPRAPDATTVVAVDRWHATSAALDDLEGARLLDQLVRLLAQGPSAGIVGLVGLDRATGLPAPLAPAAAQRIVLRLGDPHDVGLVGVPLPPSARRLLVHAPPGRGVATPAGLEVQVARP